MGDEPQNPHIPGAWFGALSLKPFSEVVHFIKRADDYTKELRHQNRSSVFKAHPGVRSTMLTDMASLEFVFNAPPTALDRIPEDPGFGGLSLNRDEMLAGAIPALVGHEGPQHDAARTLVEEAMKIRRTAFAPACQKVHDYGLPMLRHAARGEGVDLREAIHHAALSITHEWLFDISPGPSGKDGDAWSKGCFGMKSDQPLANFVARAAGRAKNGPSADTREYAQALLESVRKSAPYPAFAELGRRLGVPDQEVAAHLLFAASFNATGGVWTTLFPSICQMGVDDVVHAKLAAELAGFRGDGRALNALPALHDFFLESMRLFGRPRHYYRRAMTDLLIPVSEGDPVPVAAGTTLCLVATVARQDRTVWGDDASVFDPERYARKPELRERVYPFGPPPTGGNRFGCAGATNGVAAILWKSIAAPLARAQDWTLTPWPEPDVDEFDGVTPREVSWSRR